MNRIRRMSRRSAGFSLIELLIVIAIILIIATIALPKLNRARMYAQETAAISHIRTIHTAQTQYFSQFGKFAPSLTELGPPTSGQANAAAADLIPGDLAAGDKGGYKFTVVGNPAGYTVNAERRGRVIEISVEARTTASTPFMMPLLWVAARCGSATANAHAAMIPSRTCSAL